jgi:hypothetical protein
MFHESMLIPSLYTTDDQLVMKRWMQSAPAYPEMDDLDDSNKVAEIALASVQNRIAQCLSLNSHDRSAIDRKILECQVPMRNKLLFPIHLCDIGRYDAHHNSICQESYFATFLPGYNIYVVTVSLPSSALYEHCDLAIDYFQNVDDAAQIASHARLVLKAWWKHQQMESQVTGWQELLKSGLIHEDSVILLGDAA